MMLETILREALRLAPFEGWNETMLREAGRRASVDGAELHRLYPAGASDLARHFFRASDEALAAQVFLHPLGEMKIPERIRFLLVARIAYWEPHREAVRRLFAFLMFPWNAGIGIKATSASVDAMWRLAGDQSLDFSFYTKRATLAALYQSALLHWLGNEDASGFRETQGFIDRGLKDIAAFGRSKRWIKEKLRMA
jgi:ubiquinone biosynthesis protein COQ9